MDIRTIFRNLFENRLMPDFDYVNCRFTFQTVFNRTSFSYCCCSCGFEHEYLDYFSDNKEIDEIIYDKIIQCVEKGQCPHVNADTPEESLKESSINAVHIAAAVGTKEAVQSHIEHFRKRTTGIFGIEPHITAAMKNNCECVEWYLNGLPETYRISGGSNFLLYAVRSKTNKEHVTIKRLSLLEICVKKKDVKLLKSILLPSMAHSNMHRAYEILFKHNLVDMEEAVIEYDKSSLEYRRQILDTGNIREGSSCALPAIVCNQPKVLDRVLNFAPAHKLSTVFKSSLTRTCFVLKRGACYEVLSRYDILNNDVEISTQMKVSQLLHLFTFYKEFREEIKAAIREIPNLFQALNAPADGMKSSFQYASMMGHLHSYIDTNKVLDPNVVKVMLELGADVDVTDVYGNSPLIQLIERMWWYCGGFRECLELLIFENPSVYLNRAAVLLGLKQDACMNTWIASLSNIPGKYMMDAKIHSLFRHDDSYDYALNFTGPLLIESGFPVKRDTLMKALNKPLHQAVLLYITKCLEEPRSLKLSCRDVLRRHFRGRNLHSFIKASCIPNRLKDFILLKSMLLCL